MSVTSPAVEATPTTSIEAAAAPDNHEGASDVGHDRLRETIRQNVMAWTAWKGVESAERTEAPIQAS
jgi:hypothetical protein